MSDNRFQLFVKVQGSPGDYLEVDLYENESVNLIDSIQDVKDISKIHNSFSKAFTIPSSVKNDNKFGKYYNNQIRQ